MVDRYMGWYGGYGMAYMRVLRCCIMWCVRQSHCRGSTVRLIVFALTCVVAYLKPHVEAFVAFYELVYFNKSSNWLSFNKIIPHACAAWRADFVKPAFETTTP